MRAKERGKERGKVERTRTRRGGLYSSQVRHEEQGGAGAVPVRWPAPGQRGMGRGRMLVLVLFPAVPQSRNSGLNKQNRAAADGGGTGPAAPPGNSPWHGRGGRGSAAGAAVAAARCRVQRVHRRSERCLCPAAGVGTHRTALWWPCER